MKMAVFCDVALHSLILTDVSEELTASIHHPGDGGSKLSTFVFSNILCVLTINSHKSQFSTAVIFILGII
jgi:hypothetical protein